MEIVKLPLGEQAPPDVDCIRIEERADGLYELTASALCVGEDDAESASIVGGLLYPTPEQAEEAGLAWAEKIGVQNLYISAGTLAHPFDLGEIDLPL